MVASEEEERARREAGEWFGRLRSRTVATDELTAFAVWRRDPLNRRSYERMEALWSDSAAMGEEPEVGAALGEALRRRRLRRWVGRIVADRVALTVAAAFAAAVAVVVLLPVPNPWATTGYHTGVGERSIVRLADGTRVRLDTSSTLVPHLTGSVRRVQLSDGQAYFDVRHDPAHPFVVEAGDGTTITALGTRFDVRLGRGAVEVSLYEGSVVVANGRSGASVSLKPGQDVTMREGRPGAVDDAAGNGMPTWTSGRLSFRETRLDVAVAELNRYTTRPVRLARPDDAGRPVSGDFAADDPDGFVAAANAIFGSGTLTRDAAE